MDTFYTSEAAFDAALQAAGATPIKASFDNVSGQDYSSAAGFTNAGINFVGSKQGGYQLSTTAAGFAGITSDYPTGSIQGPGPQDSFYGVTNGKITVTPSPGIYALGFNLFTVQSGNYAGDASDTVSLKVTDSSGSVATGSGVTSEAASYNPSSPTGFLGVISTTPISSVDLTGTTTDDNIDIAQVTSAAGPTTPAPSTPTISGTHASSTTAQAPVSPFSGVTVGDTSSGASDTLTIQLSNGGAGGALSGAGLSGGTGGTYSLAAASPSVLTSELDALSFTPSNTVPGSQSTTNFTLTGQNLYGAVTDGNTSVTDTSTTGSGSPVSTSSGDSVSLDPNPAFTGHNTFVLTGHASSALGVADVQVSAQVDGIMTSLGGAVLNGDGTFTFTDNVGASTQSFITATVIDEEGGSATASLPIDLIGATNGKGRVVAHQDTYNDDGSAIVSSSNYKSDGSQTVNVQASGLTLHSSFFDTFLNHGQANNTFVFDPGHGLDVVNGFRVDGTDHDTVSLSGSDFGNSIAEVLRNTQNTAGGVAIVDPTSGDTVKLAGITKAELRANQGDFAFHA